MLKEVWSLKFGVWSLEFGVLRLYDPLLIFFFYQLT